MFNFVTSADVTPTEYAQWYLFNTWLQKATEQAIHLSIPISVTELQQKIANHQADMVYASPYDAAMLSRDYGFAPVVKPANQSDEIVIFTRKDSPITDFVDLPSGCRVALTNDRDVKMIGLILIEPADLGETDIEWVQAANGVIVARHVIQGKADVGFVLTKYYDEFSRLITDEVKPLIRSEISVIHHTLMAKPGIFEQIPDFVEILTRMHDSEKGKQLLHQFGITSWEAVEQEDLAFMIDLMETLK